MEFAHIYADAGTYMVTVSVDDGTTNVTEVFELEVLEPVANREPELSLSSGYSFYLGVDKEIRPVEVYDPDGDPLTVWYDWGDDSPLTKGDEADGYAGNHTYFDSGTFTLSVYANDSQGHNVTEQSTINVQEANRRPKVVSVAKDPAKNSYAIGETITFVVTVWDKEGDDVTVIIDFGDGTDQTVEIMDLLPETNRSVSFTHEYDEAAEYTVVATAKDGLLHEVSEWLSASTKVTVAPDEEGISMLVIVGIGLALAVIVAIIIMLMMRKKKGGGAEEGGMEGMASPGKVEEAPPPSQPPESG